jgi:hypothetical protein
MYKYIDEGVLDVLLTGAFALQYDSHIVYHLSIPRVSLYPWFNVMETASL